MRIAVSSHRLSKKHLKLALKSGKIHFHSHNLTGSLQNQHLLHNDGTQRNPSSVVSASLLWRQNWNQYYRHVQESGVGDFMDFCVARRIGDSKQQRSQQQQLLQWCFKTLCFLEVDIVSFCFFRQTRASTKQVERGFYPARFPRIA